MSRSFLRSVPAQVLLLALVGVVTGVLWALLAQPAQWEVAAGQLQLSVGASRETFGVLLLFAGLGAVASLLWSMLATSLLGTSWQNVVTVVLGCLVAALICWQIGMLVGPPDPATAAAGLSEGDLVDDQLGVDGVAPFLVWPIAGLIGVLLVTWPAAIRDRRAYADRAIDDTTARVDDTRS